MMYCDKNGMTTRFGEVELLHLTDHSETGEIQDDILNAAISDASDEIDTYLAVRHTLPLEQVPDIVTRLCADIARYRLYDDRMLDEVKKRYDDSIVLLKNIARGTAQLPVAMATAPTGSVTATKGQEDRIFSQETLESF